MQSLLLLHARSHHATLEDRNFRASSNSTWHWDEWHLDKFDKWAVIKNSPWFLIFGWQKLEAHENDIPWTNSMFPIFVIKNPSDIPWNTGRFMTWSFFHGLLLIIIPINWVVQAPYIANQPGFLDRCLNWFPKNDGRRKNVSCDSNPASFLGGVSE